MQIQGCSSLDRALDLGAPDGEKFEIRGNNQFGGFEFQDASLTG